MKKEDVDLVFRKHHLKFSIKLILMFVLLFGINKWIDLSVSSLTMTFIGCVMILMLNLFKDVLTELFTASSNDEPLN